jgi:hypothetical protein
MLRRCGIGEGVSDIRYVGRGIQVCDRWRKFENFYADMGDPPTPGHSIDRINNDGNYEPENCRWATKQQQCRNRSSNRPVTYKGVTKLACEWDEQNGWRPGTVLKRLRRGWSIERAIEQKQRHW